MAQTLVSSETAGASLATNMKHFRKELGLSQEQLSERSGIPRSTIASLERGEGNPTLQVLMGIAQGLNVSIADMLVQKKPRATLFPSKEHGRMSYPVFSSKFGHTEQRRMETVRLTPAQLRYLVIEEVALDSLEEVVSIPHAAGTEEHFFLVEGVCEVEVAGEVFVVKRGDLLRFDGDQRHIYRSTCAEGRTRGFSVVVQTPRV